jgi:hypothetical protein
MRVTWNPADSSGDIRSFSKDKRKNQCRKEHDYCSISAVPIGANIENNYAAYPDYTAILLGPELAEYPFTFASKALAFWIQ